MHCSWRSTAWPWSEVCLCHVTARTAAMMLRCTSPPRSSEPVPHQSSVASHETACLPACFSHYGYFAACRSSTLHAPSRRRRRRRCCCCCCEFSQTFQVLFSVIDKTFKNKYCVFRYNRINVKGTPPSMSSSLLIRSVFSATLHGMALVPYCMFQVLIDFDPVKRIDAGGDTIERVR